MGSLATKVVGPRKGRGISQQVARVGRKRVQVDTKTYSGRMAVRLRELREAKGMTVEAFAEKVGAPRSTAYAWENATVGIDIDALPRIAKVLGVTIAELLPAK